MAITRDTGKDANNKTDSGTSLTVSAPGGTYDAGKLLVSVCLAGIGPASIGIPSGFTAAHSQDHFGVVGLVIAYKANSAGTETGTTWTVSGGANDIYVGTFQYSGVLTASPLDQHNGANSNGVQVSTLGTGSITNTVANDLIISAVCSSATYTSPSATSGTIINNVVSGTIKLSVAERIVTTATSYSDTFSWTNNGFANTGIVSFKPGATAPLGKLVVVSQAVKRSYYY